MKKIILTAVIITLAFLFTNEAKAEYRHGGGYGIFYSSLEPYGMWIELDDGLVVWRPSIIRRGWAPYTHGQWLWTSDGWYWDSYEDFGYITYHYGRWYFDDYYGWIWVPDNVWAPAWVEWRYDNDYIGWAPLPPYAVFSVNVGIHFSFDYHTPYHHWHFVRYRHFCDPYVNNYYVAHKYKSKIYSNTRYRTNYAYERDRVVNRGIDVEVVRNRSGQTIRQRDVERVNDPRQVTRENGRSGNDRVRTFVATQEQLRSTDDNVTIKRSERKSTLKTGNVEIGRSNETRSSNRDAERVRENSNKRNNEVRSRDSEVGRETRVTTEEPAIRKEEQRPAEKPETRITAPERKVETRRTETTPQRKIEARPERKAEQKPRIEQPQRKTESSPQRERKVESAPKRNSEPVRVERPNSGGERSRDKESSGNSRRQR